MDRANSSRTTTAPYGRVVARRQPSLDDGDVLAIAGSITGDVPAVARTRTGEWRGTSSLVVVPAASRTPRDVGMGEGCEMSKPQDDSNCDVAELDDAGYPVEPTAPGGPPCHVELVEEIPTGHATPHALEVTTIEVEPSPGSPDDSFELRALLPPAFAAARAPMTARSWAQLADAAKQVAALLDLMAVRVAHALEQRSLDPDELAPCLCSCHALPAEPAVLAEPTLATEVPDPAVHHGLAIRDPRDRGR